MNNDNKRTSANETAVISVLSDHDLLWEATGPDGITYDFDTRLLRMNEERRDLTRSKMAAHDNAISSQLAYLISQNDYEAIGRMVVGQVDDYLSYKIQEAEDIFSINETEGEA